MNKLISELVLYNNGKHFDVLQDMNRAFELFDKNTDTKEIKLLINKITSKLLDVAVNYGFCGNVWHSYIGLLLITSENAFTRMCERRKITDGSLCDFARSDLEKLYYIFNYDFDNIQTHVKLITFTQLSGYTNPVAKDFVRYKSVSKRLNELVVSLELADNADAFFNTVINFYEQFGFGDFGLNRAFGLLHDDDLTLRPVNDMENVRFDDIVGYEQQKRDLITNTRAFVEGKNANNVLLYGDSGTGKSTSIKATVNEFYSYGLRMIEVHKHQIERLSTLISELKYRNYRFIIYMDDLSFEDNENEYKYLKALIEGGVETKPDNVLIYATSNRRHLVRESWSDRDNISARNDVHSSDTLEEKLSLAARFGLTVYYPKPARKQYTDIVIELAKRSGINMTCEELEAKARIWEMHHGGISGRTARQFITSLLNEQ